MQSTHHDDKSANVLLELLVKGFDDEQVWQQLELKNCASVPKYLKSIGTLVSKKDMSVSLNEEQDSDNSDIEIDQVYDGDSDKELPPSDTQSEVDSNDEIFKNIRVIRNKSEEKYKHLFNKSKGSNSIVDDQFFKLAEMEQFLIQEDKKEMKKDTKTESDGSEDEDDIIDYFNDIPSSEFSESENASLNEDEPSKIEKSTKRSIYEDFFDPPGVEDASEDEADDDDTIDGNMYKFFFLRYISLNLFYMHE